MTLSVLLALAAFSLLLAQALVILRLVRSRRSRGEPANEAVYSGILDNLPVPVRVSRRDGVVEFVNKAFGEVCGYTLQDIPTLEAWWERAYPDPEARRAAREHWDDPGHRQGDRPVREVTCADGVRRTMELSRAVLGDRDILVMTDITERLWHEAEQQRCLADVERSEQRFRAIFANAAVGITLVDDAGRFTEVNQRFLEMTGHAEDGLRGRSFLDVTHPEDLAESERQYDAARKGRSFTPYEFVKRYLRKDGTSFWALVYGNYVLDPESGEETCFGIIVDIDERIRAQQALAASEERLSLALEATEDGLWDGNLRTGEGFFSPRWFAMLGYPPDPQPWTIDTWLSRVHPEDRQRAHDQQWAAILAGQPIDNTYRMLAADGSVRLIHSRGKIVARDEQGLPLRILGTNADVTERRRTEERYRALFDSASDAILLFRAGVVADVNRAGLVLFNCAREDILGATPLDLTPERLPNGRTADAEIRANVALVEAGRPAFLEWTLRRFDGTTFPCEVSLTPVDLWGELLVLAHIRDITERLRTQEAVARSERRFRAMFENAAVGIFQVENAARFVSANRRFQEFLGYGLDELRGLTFLDVTHPEDREKSAESLRAALAQGIGSYEIVKRYVRKDGEPVWAFACATILRDAAGKFVHGFTIVVDIDSRIKAQQALAASEERLSLAMAVSNDGLWDATLPDGPEYVNDRWYTMLGYEPGEVAGGQAAWASFIHPEDRERVVAHQQACIAAGLPVDQEYRMLARDGSVRWVHARGRVVQWDADGRPLRFVGTSTDITERNEANERYRTLFNTAKDAIFILKGGRFVDTNPAGPALFGCTRQELVGRTAADFSPPVQPDGRDSAKAAAGILARAERGETFVFEWQHRRADGTEFPAEIAIAAMDLFGEKLILVTARDLSERRRLQALMIQSEKMVSLGGLAAGMAHEINNPLGIILQGAQNIERRVDPGVTANKAAAERLGVDLFALRAYFEERNILRYLQGIREAGERTAGIVQNMLGFSRKGEAVKSPCDLNRLLERTLEIASSDYDLRKKYGFRQIAITRDFAPDLPQVPCCASEIEQVVLNLVRNAAQAMAGAATPKPGLTLRTREDEGYARIEVEDNGPGIPPEMLPRLFEPFFTTKEVGEGTGLGLSVSYFIVTTNHHGHIFAESRPSGGTAFVVRLPLRDRDRRQT